MPLATKNGAIIVKDGLFAENCGCCRTVDCDSCISGTGPSIIRVQFTLTANDGSVSFEVPLKLGATVRDGRSITSGIEGPGRICDQYVAFWGNAYDLGLSPTNPYEAEIPYELRQITYTYQGSDTYSGSDDYIGQQLTVDTTSLIILEFVGSSGIGLGSPYAPRITFVSSLGYNVFRYAPTPGPLVYYQSSIQGGGLGVYYHTPPYQSDGTSICYANWPGLVSLPIQGGATFYPIRTGTVSITVNSVE